MSSMRMLIAAELGGLKRSMAAQTRAKTGDKLSKVRNECKRLRSLPPERCSIISETDGDQEDFSLAGPALARPGHHTEADRQAHRLNVPIRASTFRLMLRANVICFTEFINRL